MKSPDGITAVFADCGVSAVVVPLQIAAGDLAALVDGLRASASVGGLIATVPRKFGLAAHCATLTDRARFLGSANVARRNPDGSWHGDQVDGAAFVAAIRANAAGGVAPAGSDAGPRPAASDGVVPSTSPRARGRCRSVRRAGSLLARPTPGGDHQLGAEAVTSGRSAHPAGDQARPVRDGAGPISLRSAMKRDITADVAVVGSGAAGLVRRGTAQPALHVMVSRTVVGTLV